MQTITARRKAAITIRPSPQPTASSAGDVAESIAAPSAERPAAQNMRRAGRRPRSHHSTKGVSATHRLMRKAALLAVVSDTPKVSHTKMASRFAPSRPPAARRGRYVSNHSEVRLEGALADLGVAVVPAFVAREALDAGSLVRVLPGWEYRGNYQGHAYVLYPPNRFMAPKCRALVDHLLGALSVSSSGRAPPRARS